MDGARENGQKFGKYHLIEKIAVGGMAELYRAKLYGAGGFEKDLAIKKILPNLADDIEFTKMFLDEAMITVTLNHGNIVSVIDFGEVDGQYFLVMEFVDGVDLQMLLQAARERNEPLPPQLACYIAVEVCRGLDYAHRKQGADGKPLQIVHRDISPQNIMLSFEGEVKITDFGIARAASRVSSTQAGIIKGKLAYMSPEQISGSEVDRRTDIYAVGVMMYEMLTNERPFEGSTPQETLAAITTGSPKKPHKLNRRVDKRLSAIVMKALERNPRKRYQTAGELAADLSSFLHRAGLYPEPAELARFVRELLPGARPRIRPPTPPAGPVSRSELKPMVTDVMGTTSQDIPAAGSDSHPLGEAVSFEDLGLGFGFEGPIEPPNSTRPTDPVRPAVDVEQLRAPTIIGQPAAMDAGGEETQHSGQPETRPAAEHAPAAPATLVQERAKEKAASGTSADAAVPDIHAARTLLFKDETAESKDGPRQTAEQSEVGEAVPGEPDAPSA
ncbi:MAG: serine/threonine protein kinase, partial [Deltaproteobacteria bacterium]